MQGAAEAVHYHTNIVGIYSVVGAANFAAAVTCSWQDRTHLQGGTDWPGKKRQSLVPSNILVQKTPSWGLPT